MSRSSLSTHKIRLGRSPSGWWAEKGTEARGSGLTGGSFWDVVTFFVVPRAYYVRKYKRGRRS